MWNYHGRELPDEKLIDSHMAFTCTMITVSLPNIGPVRPGRPGAASANSAPNAASRSINQPRASAPNVAPRVDKVYLDGSHHSIIPTDASGDAPRSASDPRAPPPFCFVKYHVYTHTKRMIVILIRICFNFFLLF